VTAIVGLLQVAGSTDTSAAVAADPVLLLAGDISKCSSSNDEATAKILDAYPSAAIQTLGDNVYEDATTSDWTNCYQPTWGRHKARTRPAAGNHEYQSSNATPYFNYFGAAAGKPGEGWYSYNLGAWHIVVLNSNCSPVGGCSAGSPQERWLRADLAAHPAPCTLAVWHHPRFSARLATSSVQAFWKALSDYEADVVMAGHSHHYERFALLGPSGSPDPTGIRSFVVGTGGAELHSGGSATTGSEVRNNSTYGVMRLTLRPQGYDWKFLPKSGQTFTDSGSEACRGSNIDNAPPTPPSGLVAKTPLGRVDLSWQASSDNVGVSGYDVLRNGAVIATIGAVTSYTDSTVASQTTYTYQVRARDAAGNLSALSNSATVTTPEPLTLHTYAAAADARVEEANPSTNYGAATILRTGASPAYQTYLRFNVTGLSGPVHSARLRLYATNASADGPTVRTTTSSWGETTLTWANRPVPVGAVTDDRGAISVNAYSEWDVTPSIQADGTLSFVLAQPGTDAADFSSREAAANRPQLIVAVNGAAPPADTTRPSAPTGLTAVPSPGRVALEWQPATDNVAVTGYEIFRNGALLAEVGAVTSYADTTVAASTQYTYEVRALDAAGNRSLFSNAASATTPAAGQTLTFAPTGDARVEQANPSTNFGTFTTLRTVGGSSAVETNLAFNVGTLPAAVQSAKLRLYVTGDTVDGPAVYRTETGWTERSVTWSNRPARTSAASDNRAALGFGYAEWDVTSLVPPSGEIAFVLAQTSTDGTTFNSKEASSNRPQLVVTLSSDPPPDTTPPSKPTGLTANAVAGRVDLSWQAATDEVAVTGYDIFRNGAPLASVGAVTTYADTTVAGRTSYTYTIRARDAAGNTSPLSDPATVTTPDSTPPSKPTGLTATAVDGRVDLGWQAATDDVAVTGYEVLRNGAPLASIGDVTAYTDTTVAAGTTYTYTVRARDAAGNLSSPSDAASATIPDTTPPSKPTGVTANALAGRVELRWQASTDDVAVSGYEIFRDGVLLAAVGAVTSYADTSVAPNTSYEYTVRARDAAGNRSPFSDPVTVTASGEPQTFTFSAVADARVEAATPSTNFGTSVLIGTDFSPDVDTYITFDVSGLTGTVQSARLRLYAPNGSVDGPAVHQTSPEWDELTLNWSNRPAPIGAASDDRVAVTRDAWSEWDVTPFVTGNGAVSFMLTQPGTDGADFHSREATATGFRPQLVVTVVP